MKTLALAAILFAFTAQSAQARQPSTEQVIRQVFGVYGSQAVRVFTCESGLRTWAQNGQYLGIAQMGSWARARYGHGPDAYTQARAAYHYFRDNGYSWRGAWSCSWAA